MAPYRSLFLLATLLVFQVTTQPMSSSESDFDMSEQEVVSLSEDELGKSLSEFTELSDEDQEMNYSTLHLQQPESEDSFSDYELGLSMENSTMDELGVSCNDMSGTDNSEEILSTHETCEDYEIVRAKMPSPRKTTNILKSEVSCGKRLKSKALSILSIKSVLNAKCLCGKQCMKKMTIKKVRTLREGLWQNSRTIRMQLLKNHIINSKCVGKFRFVHINAALEVCSRAFMTIYRIDKNTFSKALDMSRRDTASLTSKKPRDLCERTINLINWLEEYATYHGDRMPDSCDVVLPYRTKKVTLFEKFKHEGTLPVSRTQFFNIWERYFPHLKIKKTNSFSKCTTCVTLERQLEKTTCVETRVRYRQLKEDHNNRQMMERKYYYEKRESSRRNPAGYLSFIIDGMDQSKSNLPHFTGRRPKNINAADLLKTHITGVISHGHGGFHTYVDINEYPHDPNLTINILLLTLKRIAVTHGHYLPPVCYVQADNCFRENKNKYVLAFCELLVKERIFNEIHLSFLYVGHTHEDVDAAFSKISETLRTTDVETMSDLMTILPKSEHVKFMFDVKSWIAPHINHIEKHSEPLHFKFIRKSDDVQICFKGRQSDPWNRLNGNILLKKPTHEPTLVLPNYLNLDKDRLTKQINIVKTLFKDSNSADRWKLFYENLDSRTEQNPRWILHDLPRQKISARDIIDNVPPEIRELIQKEIHIPQVRIKQRKNVNDKENKNSMKRKTTAKSRKGQARRKIVVTSTAVIIPLTDDIKKHIWFNIFMDLFETFMIMLLIYFMTMYYFRIFCLLQALYDLKVLFGILVQIHVGTYASVCKQMIDKINSNYPLITSIPAFAQLRCV